MANNEPTISQAIDLICQEKKISRDLVLSAIEQALAAAYRRDYGEKNQNIKVEFNPIDGSMRVFDVKTVVEDLPPEELAEKENEEKEAEEIKKTKKSKTKKIEAEESVPVQSEITAEEDEEEKKRFNPKTDLQLSDAKKINKKIKIGETITTELKMPTGFGRVAAQTAKQVIVQKIREAERQTVFDRYKAQEGTVINGIIQRYERNMVLVELQDTTAILPASEQIIEERYMPNQKFKFYLQVVRQTPKGPEIIVSRRHPEILKELFVQEIPEITNGTVEIKAIAREAGSRAKVAVFTQEKGVDPVGACIGQRGVRIQTIISELGGEKIDIIEWSEDLAKFITNALSPAKVQSIEIDEKNKKAIVRVKEENLSLAIGRAGQNVRLASRLTGYEIDVQVAPKEIEKSVAPEGEDAKEVTAVVDNPEEKKDSAEPKKEKKSRKKKTE
ncbi:MAG: transcription termination factor NusA [Patescibacteria group bacterium]|nr:transcription termination factor NusA [Patescibacteria group bacterium]MDD5121234.1 transcription termination factor NusA [Patescibacteria group bacterium]MDD5395847.1 transcription termination factor NusA [Patescibacteria group bacterium]